MDEILNVYIIFYVNKNGLYDFVLVKSASLKEAVLVSKSYAKASKCEILGVCLDCFKTFKLDDHE
jgi:hypothetical protein